MLDEAKGMFDSGSDAVILSVKRAIRTGEFPVSLGLAMNSPLNALRLGLVLALGADVGLVSIYHPFLPMQTVPHDLRIVYRGRGHDNVMYAPLRITADMCFHAKMPGRALFRGPHLRGPCLCSILGRRRRRDDRGIHDRALPDHQPSIP